jgi:hypothetical protein
MLAPLGDGGLSLRWTGDGSLAALVSKSVLGHPRQAAYRAMGAGFLVNGERQCGPPLHSLRGIAQRNQQVIMLSIVKGDRI